MQSASIFKCNFAFWIFIPTIQSTATLKFTNELFFQPITHEQNKNSQGNPTIQSFFFSFQDVAEQKPYDEIRVDFNIYFYMWFPYINTW